VLDKILAEENLRGETLLVSAMGRSKSHAKELAAGSGGGQR